MHRDLKPGKILISFYLLLVDTIRIGDINDMSSVKLADLGLTAKYDHVSIKTMDDHCGTLIFMAPEVALTKDYSRSVDIWSRGIVMYMLLTGGEHPLFEKGKDSPEVYQQKISKLS